MKKWEKRILVYRFRLPTIQTWSLPIGFVSARKAWMPGLRPA
jgi:hypothetical protein